MKEIFLLLGAFLVVTVNADDHVALYPIEGRKRGGGSYCMIKSRSIEVDEDVPEGKQSNFNLGPLFIPGLMDNESEDEYDEEDDYDDDDSGHLPVSIQYGSGGYQPWIHASDPATSLAVSSHMNSGPIFFGGNKDKYMYKKKGGGHLNCIIIRRPVHRKPHRHRRRPIKLFGLFLLGGKKKSIARGLRALRN